MHKAERSVDERVLRNRIMAEYLEMPGLSVTMLQGARLWNIDRAHCARILDGLLETGFLRRVGGTYVRARDGRHAA